MDELLEDQIVFSRKGTFESGIREAQNAIELLSETKIRLQEGRNINVRTALELQQGVRPSLDAISTSLKETHKATQTFGRCLDRRVRPKNSAGVEQHFASDILMNRAIAMHLLRQGHFETAARFLDEASGATKPEVQREDDSGPTPDSLRDNFLEMYHILHKLRVDRDLEPAKSWAHTRSQVLQSRGSTLEFQLSQLQYVWLLESAHVQSRTLEDRRRLAITYARDALGTMTNRYLREIQQLICAVVYTSNTEESPYKHLLKSAGAWEEVATSFTREYCSLLGLSADSPLFIACTAGALALPMLEKLHTIMREKRTEWTTEHELPVEIPLPLSYRFHPIFVCPVSKEQATQTNPPMLLPCGHVIARESLSRLSKLSKFKCPYCPEESHYKDARQISF